MTDAALVGRLLDEYHERAVAPADITVTTGSVQDSRVSYRLRLADGSLQVVRAFRADAPVPLHGRGTGAQTMADWLLGRAGTLAWLQAAGYRAPQPVRTRTGELVGIEGPWLSWASTFVEGPVTEPDARQLELTGEALGRLHNVGLPDDRAARGAPGLASEHPAVAVPDLLARLDAVAAEVPAEWQAMCSTFRQTAERVHAAAGSVPEAIVHGDVWARNVVQDSSASVTFVDWETGGIGLAVLDLATALVECHLDAALPDDVPEAWLISPDEDRISAVTSGYTSVRTVSDAELALLPDAVLFPSAVLGAVHLEAALSAGTAGPSMDARLERLRNRLSVADVIATIARDQLAGR